jgi:hypothetical protein
MARTEPGLLIGLTNPAGELSKTIQYKAPPSDVDSTVYDWEFILETINDISLIMKPATVKLITDVARKTIVQKNKIGNRTITAYSYEATKQNTQDTRPAPLLSTLPQRPQPPASSNTLSNNYLDALLAHLDKTPANPTDATDKTPANPTDATSGQTTTATFPACTPTTYTKTTAPLSILNTPTQTTMTSTATKLPPLQGQRPFDPVRSNIQSSEPNPGQIQFPQSQRLTFGRDALDVSNSMILPMWSNVLKRKGDDIDTTSMGPVHDWATAALTLIAKAEPAEKDHQKRIAQLMAIAKDMSENSPMAYAANTIDELLLQHRDDKQGCERVSKAMKDVFDRLDLA